MVREYSHTDLNRHDGNCSSTCAASNYLQEVVLYDFVLSRFWFYMPWQYYVVEISDRLLASLGCTYAED